VEFIKYMTSPEVAARIIEKGIGMAPSTAVDYDALADSVEAPEAKLLVEACRLCQNADYQALGLGNNFGDAEGEIQAKYAGLKDGSKTVESAGRVPGSGGIRRPAGRKEHMDERGCLADGLFPYAVFRITVGRRGCI
jgi:hypothetical protein